MFVKFVSDSSVQKAGFSATFIKELDECELQDHGCEHECINTLGGYQCSCYIGYELHSDKKTCESECSIKFPVKTLSNLFCRCLRRSNRHFERHNNVAVISRLLSNVKGVRVGNNCS